MISGIVFIIGLCVGSLLNVLIDRLPKGESIWIDRSRCDHCKKKLRWYELIPLLSFLMQSGRCRRCHKKFSLQYPLVELTTGLGFVHFYAQGPALSLMLIFGSLLVIFVADLKYMIIPDSMVVVGVIGAIGGIWSRGAGIGENAMAGVGAALFFLVLFLITRGRGMGFGDVKLAFLLGLWLGYPKIVVGLYAAFLTGALVGVILILKGNKSLKSKIAFGPFLVLGATVAALYGDVLLKLWEKLF